MDAKIATLSNVRKTNWDDQLAFVIFNYNTCIHPSTKLVSFEMMYGRKPVLPFDHQDANVTLDYDPEHANILNQYLSTLNEQAKQHIMNNQERYKERYDRNRADPTYNIGDLVLVKTLNFRSKFDTRYEGSFCILRLITHKDPIQQHLRRVKIKQSESNKIISAFENKTRMTSKEAMAMFIKSIEASSWDNNEGFSSEISYIGLDPLKITSKVIELGRGKLNEDLPKLISLFFERGNNIDRILGMTNRTSQIGLTMIKELKEKYELKSSSREIGTDGLSLARISLAFPIASLSYAKHRKNDPIAHSAPKAMSMQAFSSVIPKSKSYSDVIINCHGWFMHSLSLLISKGYSQMSYYDQYRTTLGYVMTGVNNSRIDDALREQTLVHHGVIIINAASTGGSVSFSKIVQEYSESFKQLSKDNTQKDETINSNNQITQPLDKIVSGKPPLSQSKTANKRFRIRF